jgi:hypothetical protein
MNPLKTRSGILAALLLALGVLGLAGCGGDNPTATPVVPTATTMTTTTEATATTSTETTMDPTATTSTETTMDPTATTSSGSSTGSDDAMDLLTKAGKATSELQTLHMSIVAETSMGSSKIEADIEKPDKYRMVSETAGVSAEIIIIGDKSYTKAQGMDQYIEGPADTSALASADASDIATTAQNATIVGEETINGVNTTHVSYTATTSDASGAAASSQTDLWIDESTGYIHQIKVVSEAGGVSSTSTITYSKFNEPISPPIEKPENIMTLP